MWTCKQVSKALEEKNYEELSLFRRIALRIHIALCIVCGRYNKQVILMQDTCCKFKKHTEKRGDYVQEHLCADSKKQMEEKIAEAISKQSL